MPDIGGVDLSKKIGPVPIWVIAVAGGLGVAWFVNRSAAGGNGGSGTPLAPESGVGGTPGGFVPAPQPDETTAPPGILDNEAWAFKAVGWLIAHNYNPIEAGIAVRKYLDGEKITARELAMITAVAQAIGLPPNIPTGGGVIITPPTKPAPTPTPIPKPTPAPKPAPTPAPKPPAPKPAGGVWVTVTPWPTRDSTLWGIATKHLGNGALWPRIWNDARNAAVKRLRGQPNRIRAGDKFWVAGGH